MCLYLYSNASKYSKHVDLGPQSAVMQTIFLSINFLKEAREMSRFPTPVVKSQPDLAPIAPIEPAGTASPSSSTSSIELSDIEITSPQVDLILRVLNNIQETLAKLSARVTVLESRLNQLERK